MDTRVTSSPRKARKSVRSLTGANGIPNLNQPVSNAISSVSSPVRKNARKSTGTRNIAANSNQVILNKTRSSVGISQDSTLPLPQASCSKVDDLSDSDPESNVKTQTSSSVSSPARKNARKSTGTRNIAANSNQVVSNRTRPSVKISQDSTVPLSQPSCSRVDDLSDSDTQPAWTRSSVTNSLNSTVPFSQPGCSRDPDSSDSDYIPGPTQKILRRNTPASNNAKKTPGVVSSSSVSSTSEESEVEEILRKKTEKKRKAEAKTSSQKPTSASNVAGKTPVNPSNLASQCVFYILGANRSKKAIKRRDIIQHVFESRYTQMFPEVIKKAASMLQKTFGFELMELKSNKNEYLLVNKLCHQYGVQEFAEYSRAECQKQGFIFYILTLIFMNENSITEDELWKALDPLGIEIKSRKPHPLFGDVQKFVTSTLVKQMYLDRQQLSKDPPQYELTWGERAHKEVLKEDLLEFVCKIMTETTPKEWILQYKDAKGRSPDDDEEAEME